MTTEENWKTALANAAAVAQVQANLLKSLSDTAPMWPPPPVVVAPVPPPVPPPVVLSFPTTRNGHIVGVDGGEVDNVLAVDEIGDAIDCRSLAVSHKIEIKRVGTKSARQHVLAGIAFDDVVHGGT